MFTFIFLEIVKWYDPQELFIWFDNYFSYKGLFIFYFISTFFYLRWTNHNFIFKKDILEIEPSLFKLNSKKEFKYSFIKEVVIKHEPKLFNEKWYTVSMELLLFILFPFEYKWVEIKTKSNTTYKFLCFGFEYDYYDNCDSGQLMEDIFSTFSSKNVKVRWTNSDDNYFNDMNKEAEKLLSYS